MAIAAGKKRLTEPVGLRAYIEGLDPARYLASSYYERWMGALEDALIEQGHCTTKEDLDRRTAHFAGNPDTSPQTDAKTPRKPRRWPPPSTGTGHPSERPTCPSGSNRRRQGQGPHHQPHRSHPPPEIHPRKGGCGGQAPRRPQLSTTPVPRAGATSRSTSTASASRPMSSGATKLPESECVYIDMWDSYLDPEDIANEPSTMTRMTTNTRPSPTPPSAPELWNPSSSRRAISPPTP